MKNIGGSLFSSSDDAILRPIKLKVGTLQIVPDEQKDTHRLNYINGESVSLLASHPNGFSCHSLATRWINSRTNTQEDRFLFLSQAEYIILCGGFIDFVALNNARLTELGLLK
jgi:hypothetical protein